MKKLNSAVTKLITVSAICILSGAKLLADQPIYPAIIRQPEDQAIAIGSKATFTVSAVGADGYQWLRNGIVMAGKTNRTLSIENVSVDDVAFYTCNVAKNTEDVPTRSAVLNAVALADGAPNVTVFGAPLPSGGGSPGSCPGSYAGYVNYIKTTGWGWVPTGTVHTATDTNRTDTKVQYLGRYGEQGCNQTTVTIPHPTANPKYRFTIFFPNNVPTNPYAITLTGFLP